MKTQLVPNCNFYEIDPQTSYYGKKCIGANSDIQAIKKYLEQEKIEYNSINPKQEWIDFHHWKSREITVYQRKYTWGFDCVIRLYNQIEAHQIIRKIPKKYWWL